MHPAHPDMNPVVRCIFRVLAEAGKPLTDSEIYERVLVEMPDLHYSKIL